MKKLLFLLLASGGALSVCAQTPSVNTKGHKKYAADSLLSRVVVDVNVVVGALDQEFTTTNSFVDYLNYKAGSSQMGKLKFSDGLSYGFDAQIGYFFGKKRHFGLGLGFMYLQQQGDVVIDNFHVAYQAFDENGHTYTQMITSNGKIKERINSTNLNIPLVLKYKARLSKRLGFTADLGALFNVQMRTRYSTNANFDYEAAYHLEGAGDNVTSTYDNSPNVLYTRAEYERVNPGLNVRDYFNTTLRNAGYNVGLDVMAGNNSGSVSYATGSVGFIVRPALNYFLSDNVALNIGAYYIYQPFTYNTDGTYRITDQGMMYNSALNSVTSVVSQSYGGNLGVRVFLGKGRDTDKDGIPDKDDWCPYVYGSPVFHGCPDTDGDGIMDPEDSCVRVPGILKFHGCPDSDGDGITDKEDACPFQAGPATYKGCPDRDGDGIIDKEDNCPDKAGLAKYKGCPDTDGDGLPDPEDKCPEEAGPIDNHGCPLPPPPPPVEELKVSTPILFELNKTIIREASFPVLELAVRKLNEDKEAYVIVDGYTDITGKPAYNRGLSLRRAQAVKAKLKSMGISAKRIKVVGHGASSPAASNDTEEGRMQNRRAVMHLSVGE
jgi:outer membrane protein OmpA-like peptidoglycan-associated protein